MKTRLFLTLLGWLCVALLFNWPEKIGFEAKHERNVGDERFSTSLQIQTQNWEWKELPKEIAKQTDYGITACDFISEYDGWAVGLNGVILHWDGKEWILVSSPPLLNEAFFNKLNDVEALTPENIWIAGEEGYLSHWDGQHWSEQFLRIENGGLEQISFLSPLEGFAVGGSNFPGYEKRVINRWDGKSWLVEGFPNAISFEQDLPALRAIQMVSDQDGWVSGSGNCIDGTVSVGKHIDQ